MIQLSIELNMKNTLKSYPMPFTRLELCILSVVDGELCVLLGKREEEPAMGLWAMPGGVLRIDLDADLEAAARRVATERLGHDIGVALPYLKQQCAVGGPERDPRAPWSLSIIYRALVPIESFAPLPGKRLTDLKWTSADRASTDRTTAFDHHQRIAAAVSDLRREVEGMDIPLDFFGSEFTLGELQSGCEHLLGYGLDKSSFRRKLDERQLVRPVAGEFRHGANRPAQLFTKASQAEI